MYGKEAIAFYGPIMTLSIPGSSSVHKFIVLEDSKEAIKDKSISITNKIVINNEEYTLKNQMYFSEDRLMIPLREITETLGYNVNWNQEAYLAELSKGNQWITVKQNEDNYSFAKMLVRLGKSSELINGVTYVPVNFIENVLNLNAKVINDGMLGIY